MAAGDVLRVARQSAGLSQRELAVRAGTGQPAISAIEAGRVSPSADRLAELVSLCGYRLRAELHERPARLDRALLADSLRMLPEERLELAIEISRFALATAGSAQQAWVKQILAEDQLPA